MGNTSSMAHKYTPARVDLIDSEAGISIPSSVPSFSRVCSHFKVYSCWSPNERNISILVYSHHSFQFHKSAIEFPPENFHCTEIIRIRSSRFKTWSLVSHGWVVQIQATAWRTEEKQIASLRRAFRKNKLCRMKSAGAVLCCRDGREWGQQVWLNNFRSRCSEPGWLSHLQQGIGAIDTPSKSQTITV